MKQRNKIIAWALSLLAAVAVIVGGVSIALGSAGRVPPHTKTLTDNNDGTYTLALDVVGDSEKQPNNVNVVVVFDRSGSMNSQRMSAAKTAVNNLADKLFAYNTASEPNTVQMALVSFSTNATITRPPTNDAAQFKSSVTGLSANGGTNWEAALDEVGNVDFGDNDQTFVIFVSDGNPTFRDTRITTDYLPRNDNPSWSNSQWQTYRSDNYYYSSDGVYGLGSDNPDNSNYSPTSMQRCYDAALPKAKAIVQTVGASNFFTIGAYGDVSRMQTLTTEAGADSKNFYSASDTTALNQALADILAKIEMAGIGNASIEDGTTNQVTTSSGKVAELLEVDTGSFKYYRSGGSYGSMQEWADAPKATFADGKVDWNLEALGVLENGVRYTVTFDCYPSQETYDIIARLKNGDVSYSDLDPEIQKYIVDNGGGSYSLRTNTNATLSYDDTRDEAGQQTEGYTNPDPVATAADSLPIEKKWEGEDPDVESVPVTVMMDGEAFHTVSLEVANDWKASSFISVGIIKNGKALPGAEGHDFSFAELSDEQYRWELDAPTVHPMRIGSDIVMLIKVDESHPAPAGATTYTIGEGVYYVDSVATGLTATNHRRSNLNLKKVVTGEDAPAGATFPFMLTVNNSKAPAAEPAGDAHHNSDYWVWFSIYDTEAGATVTDATVSGATGPNADGYYYAPSGTAISVAMKDGWNLRFTNLPTGTTYTFAEGTMPEGFAFKQSVLTGTDTTFNGAQTSTGTIQNTGTSYVVTYTNDYQLTDLEITKQWNDASNQDGKRLTADELKAKLTLSPAVDGAEPTVTDNGDNTYTITYTGLPRFNNGTEVTYTVAEGAIDGYTTTGSPASDHGTITNTHTPEKTSVAITKVWDDADNQDGIRPASVSVQLKAGDTDQGDPVTIDTSKSWTYTWENLDKYANGQEIAYTADEVEVPSGYTKEVTGSAADGFTVTNKHTPETLTVDGQKTWADEEYDGKNGYERPTSITVTLTGEVTVEGQTSTVVSKTATATANEWTYSFTDLPKYSQGVEIAYKVTEEVPEGYTATYEGYNVTNTPVAKEDIIDPVTLEITKTDEVTGTALAGAVFTVTDADGVQVATATTDENGEATLTFVTAGTYTMTETAPTGYVADPGTWTIVVEQSGVDKVEYNKTDSIWNWFYHLLFGSGTDYAEGKMTITNPPVTTEVTVDKVWDDSNNQDGKRPATLTYTLTGTAEGADEAFYTDEQTVSVADDGSASYTWKDLATYRDGKPVTYEVTEDAVDGYTTEVGELSGSAAEGYKVTVTNTHEIEKTSVKVTKVWNDNNDEAGLRPQSITVKLLANGAAPTQKGVTAEQTLAGDSWTYTWTGLDKYADGKLIEYSVDEVAVDGYATAVGELTGDADKGYEVTITNSNVTIPTDTEAFFKKIVTAANPIKDATFSFTIAADSPADAPMPENTSGTAAYAAGKTGSKTVDFGSITYTEAGTYTYTITEAAPADGWTATGNPATVTVTVTGNATDGFEAEVTGGTIENAYSVKPTTASFPVKKILSVADDLTAPDITGEYTFTLAGADAGTPMPTTTSYTNPDADGGTVTFGEISYTEAGVYTYTVTESGEIDGVTNDSAASTGKTVTVTVVDNGDGTLTASPSATASEPVTFTNTYQVNEVTASIPVEKTVTVPDGLEGPDDWSYTVTAAAIEGAPEATSMTTEVTKASPSSSIGEFIFSAPGVYKYTVTESGENDGVTNGTASYDIEIVVTDNSDGTMTAVVNGGAAVKFTNSYSVEPTTVSFPVEKELVVPEGLEGPENASWTVTLTAEDGTPMPDTTAGTITADEGVTFGEISYTEPGEYIYTITETGEVAGVTNDAESAKTVTVTVVDNGDGTLTATATSTADEPLTFTNLYAASGQIELEATKVAEGFDLTADQFSFELKNANGEVLQTKTNAADGKVAFDAIPYTAAGTYTYTINEVVVPNDEIADDTHVCNVTVTVVDNGDGTLTATAEYDNNTFTNKHTDTEKDVVSAKDTQISVDGELVEAGDVLTYTITYANNTAGEATVTVTDTIPTNTTYVEGSASDGGVYADGVITWTIEGVAAGASGSVTFQVTVDEAAVGTTIENTGNVDDGENKSSSNSVTTSVPVKDVKDESGASVDGEGVQVGDTLTYEVSFTLTEDSTSVVVTDDVPANTTLVEGSVSNGGTVSGGTITWDLGALAAGDHTVSFKVTVNESAVNADAITNTASISVNNHSEVKTNTVTNTTEVGGLTVSKTIEVPEGYEIDKDAEFTFTVNLADKNGKVLKEEYAYTGSVEGTIKDGGTVTLKHGEYITIAGLPAGAQYTVTETPVAGYTAKSAVIDGTISAGETGAATAAFVNAYNTEPAKVKLEVKKAITGAAWPEGKTLTFTLAAQGDAPMPEDATATLAAAGTAIFDEIAFVRPGTYTYTITEDGFGAGWTGSPEQITATVTVTDNKNGTLTATTAYSPKDDLITNTYKATGSVELEAKKVLEGREWKDGETFTFTLYGSDGNVIQTIDVDGNKTVSFDAIKYDESDAGKTYTYTISETSALPGGVTKTSDITATVEVTDNGDGTLATKATYTNDDTITNTYTAEPVKAQVSVAKQIDGYIEGEDIYGKVVDRTFTVTMEGPKIDGKLTTTIATQGGTGSSAFNEIEYTFADMVDEQGNRVTEKDFTYTVTETAGSDAGYTYDSNSYEVVVTVTDNQNGKLEVTNITKLGDETNVKVVNEFQQESTEVTLTAHKTIEDQSNSAKDATFTFVLTPLDGAPGETQTKTVTTEGFKGSVDFDAIEFTKAGTYRYTIVETGEAPDGWTYDKTEYTVTIVVNDNFETAILENKPTINGASTTEVTFNNAYKAAATDATLQVTKEVDDRSGSAGDVSFEFALAGDEPLPATKTATAKAGETAEFGPITYEKAGTYNYTITETKGGDTTAGWTNDTTSYPVVVTVTDVDAKLVASVAYGESETDLTVTNIYDPMDATATPKARKVVDDQSNSAPDEEFTFVLTPVDGAPGEAQAKTRLNGGPVEFDELTFERVGTYTYTIEEQAGSTNGFSYDTAPHTVTITVTDPGDGQLVASIEYADATDGELVITNPYCAEPTSLVLDVNKEITGLVGTEKDATFTFQLSGEGETLTATVTGAGTTSFDEITFTKAGTYSYTVTEINDGQTGYTYDGTVYTVTVEVVDEDGQLVAIPTVEADGAETEGITFVNPYKPLATSASLVANKELMGRGLEAGEFSFQLTDAEGNVVATVTNNADGYVDFGSFAFDEAGTYTFTAVELAGSDKNITYDSSIKTFTVEVVDVDGQLVATVTCDDASATFKNVYKTNPPKKRVIPPVIKKLLPMTGDPMAAGNVIGLTAMGTASLLTGLRLRRKNKRK